MTTGNLGPRAPGRGSRFLRGAGTFRGKGADVGVAIGPTNPRKGRVPGARGAPTVVRGVPGKSGKGEKARFCSSSGDFMHGSGGHHNRAPGTKQKREDDRKACSIGTPWNTSGRQCKIASLRGRTELDTAWDSWRKTAGPGWRARHTAKKAAPAGHRAHTGREIRSVILGACRFPRNTTLDRGTMPNEHLIGPRIRVDVSHEAAPTFGAARNSATQHVGQLLRKPGAPGYVSPTVEGVKSCEGGRFVGRATGAAHQLGKLGVGREKKFGP